MLSHEPHFPGFPAESDTEDFSFEAPNEDELEDQHSEADPVHDDLYLRRLKQTLHQTSSNPSYDRFLPRYWTPEEEIHVRKIYLGSQKRPWYRKMLYQRFVFILLKLIQG